MGSKKEAARIALEELAKGGCTVFVGQRLRLEIHGISNLGEGVSEYRGFTVYVPYTAPGDVVEARVITVQRDYSRALIERFIRTSPIRVEPSCSKVFLCGGCPLQHIDYGEQLRIKREHVKDEFRKCSATADVEILPVLGMRKPWRYRNKALMPVGLQSGRVVAGFYQKRSHNIVDLKSCPVQHRTNDQTASTVTRVLQDLKIPIYDESTHTGLIRHILVRTSFAGGKSHLTLVCNGHKIPRSGRLIAELARRLPQLVGISLNINVSKSNVILGDENIVLAGDSYLLESLGELRFLISPNSFFQINPIQTIPLYEEAKVCAELDGSETVFDLYCGIGTISAYLSSSAQKVIGIESVPAAVDDARKNCELNRVSNADFYLGRAEDVAPSLVAGGISPDVVVVDPPRKGCDSSLLDMLSSIRVRRIVYVSCNPTTMARDMALLHRRGYSIDKVQPVDMFPHTRHVECVGLLSKRVN